MKNTNGFDDLLDGDENVEIDFMEDENITKELLEGIDEVIRDESAPMDVMNNAIDDQNSDLRSIWVGNVEYSATAQQLESHFTGCGKIERVTIQCNKFTGHPKGFAYIEFSEQTSVEPALALNGSLFCGRIIQVLAKRSNLPGISSTNRPPVRQALYRAPRHRFIPSYLPREVTFRPRGSGFRPRGFVNQAAPRNFGVQLVRFKPERPRRLNFRRPF